MSTEVSVKLRDILMVFIKRGMLLHVLSRVFGVSSHFESVFLSKIGQTTLFLYERSSKDAKGSCEPLLDIT